MKVVHTRDTMINLPSYSFDDIDKYPRGIQRFKRGQIYGLRITLRSDVFKEISEKIIRHYHGYRSGRIVYSGISDKAKLGYIVMEWLDVEADPLFLAILQGDKAVIDYVHYERRATQEELAIAKQHDNDEACKEYAELQRHVEELEYVMFREGLRFAKQDDDTYKLEAATSEEIEAFMNASKIAKKSEKTKTNND